MWWITIISRAYPPANCMELQIFVEGKGLDTCIKEVRTAIKKIGGRKRIRVPHLIQFVRKTVEILQLFPIFAGLSNLASIDSGSGAIARAIIDAINAKKKLEEDKQHNIVMGAI